MLVVQDSCELTFEDFAKNKESMLLHAHRASVMAKYAQAANKEAQEATMGRYCSHT